MSYISTPQKRRVLSVCCREDAKGFGPHKGSRNSYFTVSSRELSVTHVNELAPDAVMAWLFCADYDIFDVAQVLSKARYAGQLIALSPPLPNKAMICREVAQHFPMLRFDISCNNALGETAKAYFDTVAYEGA